MTLRSHRHKLNVGLARHGSAIVKVANVSFGCDQKLCCRGRAPAFSSVNGPWPGMRQWGGCAVSASSRILSGQGLSAKIILLSVAYRVASRVSGENQKTSQDGARMESASSLKCRGVGTASLREEGAAIRRLSRIVMTCALAVFAMLTARSAAAADPSMFDEGRAQGAFKAIEYQVRHNFRVRRHDPSRRSHRYHSQRPLAGTGRGLGDVAAKSCWAA